MSQFAQAMQQFLTTYARLPHFTHADMFTQNAAGVKGFTLDVRCTDIGAMVSVIRTDGEIAASFLSLGQQPMVLTLNLSNGAHSEAVSFQYCTDEWECTTTPTSAELMGCVRFAKTGAYNFSAWTLESAALEFIDLSARTAA